MCSVILITVVCAQMVGSQSTVLFILLLQVLSLVMQYSYKQGMT